MKEEFIRQLTVAVKAKLGEEYEVLPKEALKNNDIRLTGILIRRHGDVVAPVIYIDDILQRIKKGDITMQEGIDEVFKVPLESMEDMTAAKTVRNLTKQDILTHVIHGVINVEYNQEYLLDKPYRKFLDLAVVYRIFLEETENYYKVIVLTNDLCTKCGVNLTELEEAAKRNTEQRGFRVEWLHDILSELVESTNLDKQEPGELLICSLKGISQRDSYGACVLLYEDVFKELSHKLNSNLYILPSSIHEVLVLPTKFAPNGLNQIVKEINRSGVINPADILSDSVYYYNKETNRVTIAEKIE